MNINPPEKIGLYVHLPWCVKKCPYCDFNSHALRGEIDEANYINALLNDFEAEWCRLRSNRIINSIFIGGGTPSLFSGKSIRKLLAGINRYCQLDENVEITLEANPGASDESHFEAYRQAGVNRLSIGIQSFNPAHLQVLGRIHDSSAAVRAVHIAKSAGFENINLDLMYCLPGQSVEQACRDIEQAIELSPTHLSAYHLTIEPNTLFAHRPPVLPEEDEAWQIQQTYWQLLSSAGYQKYEISAYAKDQNQCQHNLNYWRFGDYLGIGAGAHGKLTLASGITRTMKPKHPNEYLKAFNCSEVDQDRYTKPVGSAELPLEYMMNILRLSEGFELSHFEKVTGVDRSVIEPQVKQAMNLELLEIMGDIVKPTAKGSLFLDDLLQLFLPNTLAKQVA